MRCALALLLAGCWSASTPPPAHPIDNTTPPEPHYKLSLGPPVPEHMEWDGSYECAQGWTNVRLRIVRDEDGRATASFEFGPAADNPSVPLGVYKMIGSATVNGQQQLVVRLSPDHWTVQPPGYVMVGLAATSDREMKHMSGKIDNPQCGAVELSRVR
jgi:hypothetical protein